MALAVPPKVHALQLARAIAGQDLFPPLPPDLAGRADQPDYYDLNLDITQLGTAKPTPEEVKTARAVLADAPYNTRPIEVAKYFRDIGQGVHGKDLRPYVRGWPVRYNPVIISFFKAARLNPLDPDQDGDATSWCAAFVNWCVARAVSKTGSIPSDVMSHRFSDAELAKGSWSASSGSFRCWQTDASTAPKQGDVIVWALDGTVDRCKLGSGHVAFFESKTASGDFVVVGGNHRDADGRQHAVTRMTMSQSFNRKLRGNPVPVRYHSTRNAGWL
jgi:hypothetical protein